MQPESVLLDGWEDFPLTDEEREVIDKFHVIAYDKHKWTRFLGIPILKWPTDLFLLHEIVGQLQPDVVVEVGTAWGGSATWMAEVMESLGNGRVISVDIKPQQTMEHPRVTYITADSTDPATYERVRGHIRPNETVMVVLDGDHHADAVLTELETYGALVTPGQMLCVEDTNLNGHPVVPEYGPGPAEALAEWLPAHPEFAIDPVGERYLFSYHTWLRRVREEG